MDSDSNKGGISRRPMIFGSLMGVAALSVRCTGGAATDKRTPLQALADYAPAFFDAEQWRFVQAMCDRLIPSDAEGPGALEAHVPVFIDKQMLTPYGKGEDWYMQAPFDSQAGKHFGYQLPFNLQQLYRKGIALTNQYTRARSDKAFADLAEAEKDEVLTDLQHDKIDFKAMGEQDLSAHYFFARVLENAKEGYLADPKYGGNRDMAAWVMINFPGARASFTDWVGMHDVKYPLGPVALNGERAKSR